MKVDVIPFVALPPRGNQIYTYCTVKGQSVSVGQVVSVPFSGRLVRGIVWGVPSKKITKKVASIERVMTPPLFNSCELLWLSRLAKFSLESLAMLIKRAVAVREVSPHLDMSGVRTGHHPQKIQTIKWISSSNLRITTIRRGQIMILVPEKIMCSFLASSLRTKLPIFEFAQTMRIAHRREVVRSIGENESCIIVATHSGVFLPFRDLRKIIIYEAGLMSHRQWDLHPRYDARVAALLLGSAKKIPVYLTNTLPSSDCMALKQVPRLKHIKARIFRRSKNEQDFLLKETTNNIASTIKNNGSVLLFHDVVGERRDYRCGSCLYLLRCDRCGGILEQKGKKMCCRSCKNTDKGIPTFCPRCSSPRIEPKSTGTTTLEQCVKRMFPGVSVYRIDRKTFPPSASSKISIPDHPTIIIGTERAFSASLPRFSLSVIVDADTLLGGSEYDISERFLRIVGRIGWYTKAPLENTLCIQTARPEGSLFKALSGGTVSSWLNRELQDRRDLLFPPFGAMLRFRRDFSVSKHGENACRKLIRTAANRDKKKIVRTGWRITRTHSGFCGDVIIRGPHQILWDILVDVTPSWSVDPIMPITETVSAITQKSCK